jgi:hypothetical protein
MGFFMRFEGKKRVQFMVREQAKKLVKIKPSFSHRKMFIYLFMIVVEVNLAQKSFQDLYPNRERGLAEDVMVARVEAESKMG